MPNYSLKVYAVFGISTVITNDKLTIIIQRIGQKHCVKTVRIRSYSGPHFPPIFPHLDWIRRDTEYLSVFSPNEGKCGKNVDQNNSEYGHFLRSEIVTLQIKTCYIQN